MSSDDSSRRPGLSVAVVDGQGRAVAAPGLAAWLGRVAPARARGAVAVAIVSDRRVRTLNRVYRGIDKATDVLSFPAERGPGAGAKTRSSTRPARTGTKDPGPGTRDRRSELEHLGDIVIARGVAERQARDAGHAVPTEWRVLALHGLLHLLGYDHESPEDAGRMRRMEARLRREGGLRAGLIEREGRG